jgi:hypothetical protein
VKVTEHNVDADLRLEEYEALILVKKEIKNDDNTSYKNVLC